MKKKLENLTRELIHGSRLLQTYVDDQYPVDAKGKTREHTITNIVQAMQRGLENLNSLTDKNDMEILKYLLLDSWIGNTDRHHNNWGIIRVNTKKSKPYGYLAPTYDHGSALASTRSSEDREKILKKDITSFYKKGTSSIYSESGKRLSFVEAAEACFQFERQVKGHNRVCNAFISTLIETGIAILSTILSRFPNDVLTDIDREFIQAYIGTATYELRRIKENFSHMEG